jgi:hypothetical protein
MELDTVVSGSAGKRRRNNDNRNDRNCKRSAVMRVWLWPRQEREVGVTWELELVGLAMRQVAVAKWNTTGEGRALESVRERRAIWGAVGR